MGRLAALLAAAALALSPCAALAQQLLGLFDSTVSGTLAGTPTAVTITSGIWTSPTDLTPATQFVNGWSMDVTLSATAPAGVTSAYAFGTLPGSPNMTATVRRPTNAVSGGVMTTGTTDYTIYGQNWLRQVYNNITLPTESANGGNAKIALVGNDFVYATDTFPSGATFRAALYTSGAVTSKAAAGVPVTNNSTKAYPRPIGVWINSPGHRIGSGQSYTVEFFGGQSYGLNGQPLAGVVFTASDGTHTVSHTTGTPTLSTRQTSTSCTGTNGSATLTACSDTSGFIVGQRVTVIGVKGEPKILSLTSNSITLGSAQTCVTTLNSGNITINGTPTVAGDGLADGGFAGATLTDANITAPVGVATITSETLTADITTASLKSTAAVVHTNATGVTAAGAHACTINHVYQGSTGAVTITVGNPVPIWAATFTQAELTSASFADGAFRIRAQAYSQIGDVVLDTQSGADGTNCDWFYRYNAGSGGAGVCDSGNVAYFAATGLDVSGSLHNLWAYLDNTGNYVPAYVWVKSTGTCTDRTCVSTSTADPAGAAGAYAATFAQAEADLKDWYNHAGNVPSIHADANGGVICVLAGTYAGAGASTMPTNVVAAKPYMTLTSALANGNCAQTGTAGNDRANVILDTTATVNNRQFAPGMRVNNVTIASTGVVFGNQAAVSNTAFPTKWTVFNNDAFKANAAAFVLSRMGVWYIANSLVDESGFFGKFTQPDSTTSGSSSMALLFGSTALCGTNSAKTGSAQTKAFNILGSVTFQCANGNVLPIPLSTSATSPQATSVAYGYTKFLGNSTSTQSGAQSNFLTTHTITECFNFNSTNCYAPSGDSSTLADSEVGFSNFYRSYSSVMGERTNSDFLEEAGLTGNVVNSGGTFTAGTYYLMVVYSLVGNPTVESSTNSIRVTGGAYTGTTLILNGSMTVELPCDPNYVATLYVDSTITNSGTPTTATLGHYGLVSGADAKQLAMCQTVTVTALGSAHTSPSLSSLTNHNEQKFAWFERFNVDVTRNQKGDWWGGTTGAAGALAGGGKVGANENRNRVGYIGNLAVMGSVLNTAGVAYGPDAGAGEKAAWLETYNPSVAFTDLSFVVYSSDRSFGYGTNSTPLTPGLNLAYGNYCIVSSTGNAHLAVPAGYAAWSHDIQGRARLNNGSGSVGPYEAGCT